VTCLLAQHAHPCHTAACAKARRARATNLSYIRENGSLHPVPRTEMDAIRRVFYLNPGTAETADRKVHMDSTLKRLRRHGLSGQRWPALAIDPAQGPEQLDEHHRKALLDRGFAPGFGWNATAARWQQHGVISLFLSWLDLIRALAVRPRELGLRPGVLVLALEDDVFLRRNWAPYLEAAIRSLPAEWQLARVGWAARHTPGFWNLTNASCVDEPWLQAGRLCPKRRGCLLPRGTQALLLETGTRSLKLLNTAFPSDVKIEHVDAPLVSHSARANSYMLRPECMPFEHGNFPTTARAPASRTMAQGGAALMKPISPSG
jgi:hypothetical protein